MQRRCLSLANSNCCSCLHWLNSSLELVYSDPLLPSRIEQSFAIGCKSPTTSCMKFDNVCGMRSTALELGTFWYCHCVRCIKWTTQQYCLPVKLFWSMGCHFAVPPYIAGTICPLCLNAPLRLNSHPRLYRNEDCNLAPFMDMPTWDYCLIASHYSQTCAFYLFNCW